MVDITKSEIYTTIVNGIAQQDRFIVACLWKNPSLYMDIDLKYGDMKDEDNQWATVFDIGYNLVVEGGHKVITESDVSEYLKKHKKCKKVWNDIDPENPYQRITMVIDDIASPNLDSYIIERKKLLIIKSLIDKGLLYNEEDIKKYTEMNIEQIYNRYESDLNQIFTNQVMNVGVYNLYDNIEKNIESWNQGTVMGMPFYHLPQFSKYIGGIPLGSVTLLGGVSNSGKSSLLRNSFVPKLFATDDEIKENKKIIAENPEADITIKDKKTVIFLNEEDIEKWQREILTWILSNKMDNLFDKNLFKYEHFYDKKVTKTQINKAIELMKELMPKDQILFIPLPKFSTDYVIKMIKQYAANGYVNFIIDTFKMDNTDNTKIDNNVRLQLVQNMTHLYNTAKKDGGLNVRVLCTVQLSKAYTLQRYLSQESLAESKNIIDVCSTGIFMRRVWDDEKSGQGKELHVYRYDDNIAVPLQGNKQYIILFPSKTREGGTEQQCVAEVNWATNTITEIGYTELSPNTI